MGRKGLPSYRKSPRALTIGPLRASYSWNVLAI